MDEWFLAVHRECVECIMITVVPVTLNWIRFEYFVEISKAPCIVFLYTVDGLSAIGQTSLAILFSE